jgi:hypothetical protein
VSQGYAPEPSKAVTHREFVMLLRQLKDWAGLTYRQLETRSARHGYRLARSTIAAAMTRESMPREEVVDGIVRACGREPAPWLQARRRLVCGTAAPPADAPVGGVRPRQLPFEAAELVGRAAESARLATLLTESRSCGMIVVTGPPGVGKSALAVHGARRSLAAFPDGQLYVDLQGATAAAVPLTPAELVRRLLRGLGITDPILPPTVDEAAAMLRAVVADRRLLVLLDNVSSVAQVRPVIPLGRRSVVMVTSRSSLTSLQGARCLDLGALSAAPAVAMLQGLLGVDRAEEAPEAVERLAEVCGYLPLSLRVAAARLAARPRWPVGALVERLSDDRRRLDELRVDDLEVRGSLEVSYRALVDGAERAALRIFHLLGRRPTPEIELSTAARLAGMPYADADLAMDRLVDAHLVDQLGSGRYRMHDLVWLLARERACSAVWPVPSVQRGRLSQPA